MGGNRGDDSLLAPVGLLLLLLCLIGAFSPYFSLYLQSVGRSAGQIAVLMSLMSVMRMLAPPCGAGWLIGWRAHAHRNGCRRRCRWRALAAFWSAMPTARQFVSMALAFFWSAALPLVETLTFSHLAGRAGELRQHPRVGSVGFIVAVLGLGYLLDDLPIRAVLWIALATLGGILLCALTIPRRSVRRPGNACAVTHGAPPARSAGAAGVFLHVCRPRGAVRLYSLHLVEHGCNKSVVGWMWTLGVVAEILVFMVCPRLVKGVFVAWNPGVQLCRGGAAFRADRLGAESLVVLLFAQILHGATFGSYHAAAVAVGTTGSACVTRPEDRPLRQHLVRCGRDDRWSD